MIQTHPRYRKMTTSNGGDVSFIIFEKEYKLRSHAVKHFLDLSEWEVGWSNIYKDNYKDKDKSEVKENISKVYYNLKQIGCSCLKDNTKTEMETEYNRIFCGKCSLFNNLCSYTGITELQDLYIDLIQNCIEKALQTPRYAEFFSFYIKQNILISVITGPIIIRAALFSGEATCYNVMTAFTPLRFGTKVKFDDILMDEKENIKKEARTHTIAWCKEDTWGIILYSEDEKNKSTRKRGKKRYDKSSKKTYRDWVDEQFSS